MASGMEYDCQEVVDVEAGGFFALPVLYLQCKCESGYLAIIAAKEKDKSFGIVGSG